MKILLISPYHGGSHQAWAEGYQRHSRHQVHLLTLPARFWKWRMHGGSVTLARQFLARDLNVDLILATDMTNLPNFLALTRPRTTQLPTVLYMHENQLTYPLPRQLDDGPMRRQKGERDLHYAFVNYASMLAADSVLFNSTFHLESCLEALPDFLKHFPDYNELETISRLQHKSKVIPVGVDLHALHIAEQARRPNKDPLILWNHRWEYDKNPEAFFGAVYALDREALEFKLALCGQNFRRVPTEFLEAEKRLAGRLVHAGYANPSQYSRLLWQADLTVSTAIHEFFGVGIVEAIYCETFPILPKRLSYPELIPEPYHASCLFGSQNELLRRLRWALTHLAESRMMAAELCQAMSAYDWAQVAPIYDAHFERIKTRRAS